jgi:HK97 family phage portal protein
MWPFKKKNTEEKSIKNDITITDNADFDRMFFDDIHFPRSVSPETAMKCSTVFACVGLISGAMSSAPVKIYQKGPGDSQKLVENHPLQGILGIKPNDYVTASTFWKMMAMQKVLNGNAYAAILRTKSGKPLSLLPLRSPRVVPYQAWQLSLYGKNQADRYRLYYRVSWDDGSMSLIDQDDMLHIPNVGWDGWKGLSTIQAGAQTMGLALSAEESATKIFENGMVSQIALSYPNKLSPDAQEKLREHLANRHAGSRNHHKPLILTEGGDVKTMSMNADDAQLLQSRQFSVIDICRFFGVPPVMVGETEKTSSFGSGVEQMFLWFNKLTMNNHFTDFEQEIEKKLFRGQYSGYCAEFDESELTRGDTKTRAEYFGKAIGSSQQPGWLTPNEVRADEGRSPIEGGDILFVPTKTQPQPPAGGDANVQK